MTSTETNLRQILRNARDDLQKRLPVQESEILETVYLASEADLSRAVQIALAEKRSELSPAAWRPASFDKMKAASMRKIMLSTGSTVTVRTIDVATSPIKGQRVLVLLATTGRADKLLGSLLGLSRELALVERAGFGCEIHVALNNSSQGAVDAVTAFKAVRPDTSISLYELPPADELSGKNGALHLLYSVLESRVAVGSPNVFAHIADDDVGYPAEAGGLRSNIAHLEQNSRLFAISGVPTTSKHTSGFQCFASARKRPDVLQACGPLPQVYGAALTLRWADFPLAAIRSLRSVDYFLSVHGVALALSRGSSRVELIDRRHEMPARTNPRFLVEHTEATTFTQYAWRYLRDLERRDEVAQWLDKRSPISTFEQLRRSAFRDVTDALHSDCTAFARIGDLYLERIRAQLRIAHDNHSLRAADVRSVVPPGISEDEHEFCEALSQDSEKLAEAIDAIEVHAGRPCSESDKIHESWITPAVRIKRVEAIFRKSDKLAECPHPIVRLLGDVVRRNDQLLQLLKSRDTIRSVFRLAGLDLETDFRVLNAKSLGNVNAAVTVTSGERRFHLRFHNPLGGIYSQKYSSPRTTYVSVVVQRIFAELLGEDHVIPMRFPSLDYALEWCRGWRETDPIERIAQSVLIQEDISSDHHLLSEHRVAGVGHGDAALMVAGILGRLHGRSLGLVCDCPPQTCDKPILRLLRLATLDLRFASAEAYAGWISRSSWITRLFDSVYSSATHRTSLIERVEDKNGPSLMDEFQAACSRSIKRYRELGCIGHLDLTFDNVFVSNTNSDDFKVFDFNYATFIDPAYEAGQSLYSALKYGLVSLGETRVDRLLDVAEKFRRAYQRELLVHAKQGNILGNSYVLPIEEMGTDMYWFAGIPLVSVLASQVNELSLTSKQVEAAFDFTGELLRNARHLSK